MGHKRVGGADCSEAVLYCYVSMPSVGVGFPDEEGGISGLDVQSDWLMFDGLYHGDCFFAAAFLALNSRSFSAILISRPRSVGL